MLAAVIREGEETDFAAAIALVNRVWPFRVGSVAGWRHAVRAEPAEAQRRFWAAEQEGALVGWASAALDHESAERPGIFSISVVPEHRGRGLGGALFERCDEHLRAIGAARFDAGSEDSPAARGFLEGRGFRHAHTSRISGVVPAEVEPASAPAGVELRPLADLDPALVFALDEEASLDIPNQDLDDLKLEQWLAEYWRNPDVDLESSMAAVVDGRPVSFSHLFVGPASRGMTAMTGTLRSYRGRGLAELVKRATLARAAARGIQLVVTYNDETNAAMLHVNEKLGYVPLAALLGWKRP
jgi:GNAT superfamily N-acetyltransferase